MLPFGSVRETSRVSPDIAEPDEHGEALVTGLSAHAWTEVYFKGFGWLTFDATPKSGGKAPNGSDPAPSPYPSPAPPEPTPSPEPEGTEDEPTPDGGSSDSSPEPTPEPTPEAAPEPTPVPSEEPYDTQLSPPPDHEAVPPHDPDRPGSFPWLWLLLLLLLIAFALRVWFTSPSFRARRAKGDGAVFNVWTQEVTDLLGAENFVREKGESPMAFGRRVDRNAQFSVALGPVGECVSLIRYSRAEAAETDIGLVRDTSILLKGELSKPARLRYLMRRIFIPVKRRDSL